MSAPLRSLHSSWCAREVAQAMKATRRERAVLLTVWGFLLGIVLSPYTLSEKGAAQLAIIVGGVYGLVCLVRDALTKPVGLCPGSGHESAATSRPGSASCPECGWDFTAASAHPSVPNHRSRARHG